MRGPLNEFLEGQKGCEVWRALVHPGLSFSSTETHPLTQGRLSSKPHSRATEERGDMETAGLLSIFRGGTMGQKQINRDRKQA